MLSNIVKNSADLDIDAPELGSRFRTFVGGCCILLIWRFKRGLQFSGLQFSRLSTK